MANSKGKVVGELEDLLLKPPFEVIKSLCNVIDDLTSDSGVGFSPKDLCDTILSLFTQRNLLQHLLRELIKQEVENTRDESTLFRHNTITTKLLTNYSLKTGIDYLRSTLRPILLPLQSMQIEDYEIDKSRIDILTKEKIEQNTENLIEFCRSIINRLQETEEDFPLELRMVCRELNLLVREKFPSAQYSVIGGLLFLRFICPAIITPEQFGILPRGKVGKSRRILVLVSKILQNVSNNFISKSEMDTFERMNAFVKEMSPVLNQFFIRLCEREISNEELATTSNENQVSKHLERVIEYLKAHIHKLGVTLVSGHSAAARKQAQDQASEKKGFLYKYGENIVSESWRKRYFVLREGQLMYFKSIEDSHAAGTILLPEAEVKNIDLDEFSFQIETLHRVFWLKGNSKADVVDWTNKIQKFTKQNRLRGHTRMTTFGGAFVSAPVVEPVSSGKIFRIWKGTSRKGGEKHNSVDLNTVTPARQKCSLTSQRSRSAKYTKELLGLAGIPSGEEPKESNTNSSGSFMGNQRQKQKNRRNAPLRDRSVTTAPGINQGVSRLSPSNISTQTTSQQASELQEHSQELKTLPTTTTNNEDNDQNTIFLDSQEDESLEQQVTFQLSEGPTRASPPSSRETRTETIWGYKPVTPAKTLTPFGTFRRSTPKDKPTRANRSTSICAHRITMAPVAKKHAGKLEIWDENSIKWKFCWFVLFPTALHQYLSQSDEESGNPPFDKILLPGAMITSAPPSLTIHRGEYSFTLRAFQNNICTEWKEQIESRILSPNASLSGLIDMKHKETDAEWIPRWIELGSSVLSTFEVKENINVPGAFLHVAECVVHRPEIPLTLGLQDSEESFFLRFTSEEQIKKWMYSIKQAKVQQWKQQAEKGTLRTHTRKNSGLLDRTCTPPLKLFRDAVESGFLLKYESKDTKGLCNRYFFVLREQTLYYYLTEYCESLIGLLEITSAMIRTNESDDSYLIEVVGKRETLYLEAADTVDFRSWHRSLHATRMNLRSTANTVQLSEETTQRGILTSFGRQEMNYMFILSNSVLSWYPEDDKELKSLVGSIGIENCTFCDFYDPNVTDNEQSGFQIISPNQKDLLLLAQSASEKRTWLNQLKKAKLQYWRSPTLTRDVFDNRGFLWKIIGKKRLRRWLVLNDTYLLFFKSPKDHSPEGEIPLEEASLIPIECRDTNFRFEIHHGDRVLVFDASNMDMKDRWIVLVKNVRSRSRQRKREPVDHSIPSDERYLALRRPDHEGYLMKQGAKVKNWKRRFFILQYPCLFYFASSQISPGEHTGVIPLKDAKVVVKKQNNSIEEVIQFQIETRFRIFFLRADSEEDLDQWVQVIQRLRQSSPQHPESPLKSEEARKGFLVKRDRSNRFWKKRYFVLSSGLLSYYRNEHDENPMGMIPLEGCSVNIADESLRRKFCFVVCTRYRNYFLEAVDQFEMAGWIESIRFHSQTQATSDTGSDLNFKNVDIFNHLNSLLAQHDRDSEKMEEIIE